MLHQMYLTKTKRVKGHLLFNLGFDFYFQGLYLVFICNVYRDEQNLCWLQTVAYFL